MAKGNRPPHHNTDFMLTTPYNFVPLSKQVVRAAWAGIVSHDVPFADAQCGTLQLHIKAEQPIFTRNSVSRCITDSDKNKELGSHFSAMPDNRFFLPGSSIKGAVRNVLEIMSFGDLAKGLNEERYSMRDLQHNGYKAKFALNAKHKVQGGWLYESKGSYLLNDCGEPKKVPQKWIDEHFETTHFSAFSEGKMQMNDEYKAAQKKYNLFSGKDLTVDFEDVQGTLVFTGQPSANTNAKAKVKEFLFPASNEIIEVLGEVVAGFKLAYYDSDQNAQKPDYKYWSEKLRNGERIPVFFHKNDKGEVASFGLAYMYKIPFTYSVKEAIERYQKDAAPGMSLAECIFGHVEKNNALKGRVTFGHALAEGKPVPAEMKKEVLNSPKATYYPTYIRQFVLPNGKVKNDDYKTLFDKDAVPSGWKRYPVHNTEVQKNPGPEGKDNTKLQTHFRPLPAGTQFTCTVNFHNLKKIELGALLSALTFHQTAGCYHALGGAKPLGYGKCSITVSGLTEAFMKECMGDYEQYMEAQLKEGWLNSPQLQELIATSRNQENKGRSELKYMRDVKDFAKAKKDKLALDSYTRLDGISAQSPASLCTQSATKNTSTAKATESAPGVFEQYKQSLIAALKEKQTAVADAEKNEQKAEAQRQADAEARKLQQEKEAEAQRKETAAKQADLAAGINLAGVALSKTMEGLGRALKRWTETLNGSIGEPEIAQIKLRLTYLWGSLRERDRAAWQKQVQDKTAILNDYLTPAQLAETEAHLSSLS